jgi:hypothetical protein
MALALQVIPVQHMSCTEGRHKDIQAVVIPLKFTPNCQLVIFSHQARQLQQTVAPKLCA